MNKSFGVLAHVDAGKTTFCEQLLYHTKSIKNCGRVDYKNTFMDNNEIEKQRGITIFSEQGYFKYNNSDYFIVDTPGHMDFFAETQRAMWAMDYAIVVLSAVEGVQSHTETLWHMLRECNIPVFFFINKVDRETADVNRVISEIENKFGVNTMLLNNIDELKNMTETNIEILASQNDELFESYINGNTDSFFWIEKLMGLIKHRKLFVCMSGSALRNIGISDFLEVFDRLSYTEYNQNSAFSARVYKIRYDGQGNRITFMKLLAGCLNVKDILEYNHNEETLSEKINQIRVYNALKFNVTDIATAGQIIGVLGLTNAKCMQSFGEFTEDIHDIQPALTARVLYDDKTDISQVRQTFKILEAEEPVLNVQWNDELSQLNINIMGLVQLEVLKQLVLDRFKLNIDFGKCEVLYRETVKEAVMGYGHYEPLKHYAEVHLRIEPNSRGKGVTFASECHVDNLAVNYQKLIRTHIFEKVHKGVLTGSPLTDINIVLVNGRSHLKHTEGGDFREATYRAIRQGLEKAEMLLLEPYYRFRISVPTEYIGRVMSDIQKRAGSFEVPDTACQVSEVVGYAPVESFMDYATELLTFSKGRGSISLVLSGYDICHNTQEVVELKKYDKGADVKNTSASVFCSKGAGFLVTWDKAEDYMHLLK